MRESNPQWQAGDVVQNRFQIVRRLGVGGMGEVYLAEDCLLGRKVALKLLPAKFTTDADRLRRFEQEARAASALNHTNVVTIYDVSRDGSAHFIVAEFIEGEPLRHRIAKARMCVREALDVAIQIADALSLVHRVDVIHRDIKPENIMLRPDGHIKILDFGLAKLTNGRSSDVEVRGTPIAFVITEPGVVLGTPGYMSPEQACGEVVDQRTDIFSLGVVLYEMIAGRRPFEGKTIGEVIASTISKEPTPLKEYAPEVPDELQEIIGLALCKDKEKRNQTADELMKELKKLRYQINANDTSEAYSEELYCFPQQNSTIL